MYCFACCEKKLDCTEYRVPSTEYRVIVFAGYGRVKYLFGIKAAFE